MSKTRLLKLGAIFIGIYIVYRIFFVNQVYWSGVYYPHGDLAGNAIYSPHFQYKEECIGWAINEKGLHPEDSKVPLKELWECNKNCKLSPSYLTLINSTQEYRRELVDNNRGPTYVCDDGGFDGEDWLRGDF